MSVPVTEFWFSWTIRRNRKSFMLAMLALFVIMVLVWLALIFFNPSRRSAEVIFLLFAVPNAICGYLLTGQRLRDFNVTGWLALLWLPVGMLEGPIRSAIWFGFLIVLCSVPGTAGENRYGFNPLDMEG
ncbi:DUF805 domain-containing protein [Rhizobium chutanense]|uniref:DUF805 domain-containing protein n=1 Tax=Rhizobium chutanense TaxID=2035448 RepID=A0A432NSY9_9HYPH|nr:DUF805 domain-containing protein [Rhizobium chutanense]RUM02658.1 DUF805 domain-containing protein [Rhizobium chutanense]